MKKSSTQLSLMSESGIVFLGVCERFAYVRDGNTNLFKWNILGLKNIILSYIFPIKFRNLGIGLAIDYDKFTDKIDLRIIDKERKEVGFIKIQIVKNIQQESKGVTLPGYVSMILVPKNNWSAVFLPAKETDIIIYKPGIYNICLSQQDELNVIGQLDFVLINPPPLTQERIAAIKSDPTAVKSVRMDFKCKKCLSKFKMYAALQPDKKLEADGYLRDNTVPDEYICDCGKTRIDLQLPRKNLHGYLGLKTGQNEELDFSPLYEKSVLEGVRDRFISIINSKPPEELLQKFIQENPILLHQFPAEKIFFKPPLLNQYHADFGIVTPQKELILIEIETAHTRLMKKNGGIAAPLTHAFDQIRNWLHVADEHRLAVLESISIEKDEVSSVRGIVIAGRDSSCDKKHIRKLKGIDWGKISFLTYDDLLFALDILIRKMFVL